MKKIHLLTKIIFHISNMALIILYLYPGSILGWLIYSDFRKQPQLTNDFLDVSSSHIYAFIIISLLGLISFNNKKVNFLFMYLFSISLILELLQNFIPKRSFEYPDLFGNFLGVSLIFLLYKLYRFFKAH